MPFKSKAQRRKFAELLVKGEISPETLVQTIRAVPAWGVHVTDETS